MTEIRIQIAASDVNAARALAFTSPAGPLPGVRAGVGVRVLEGQEAPEETMGALERLARLEVFAGFQAGLDAMLELSDDLPFEAFRDPAGHFLLAAQTTRLQDLPALQAGRQVAVGRAIP